MSRSLLTNETSELDLLDQRPFDQTDFDILKSYEAVVDGLAMLIGSHCEIVLHSCHDLFAPTRKSLKAVPFYYFFSLL